MARNLKVLSDGDYNTAKTGGGGTTAPIGGSLPTPGPVTFSDVAGGILETAFLPLTAVAQVSGVVVTELGRATNNKDLEAAGHTIVDVSNEVQEVIRKDPLPAAEMVAGGALAVTGIATAPGLALLGAGLGQISAEVMHNMGAPVVTPSITASTPNTTVPTSVSSGDVVRSDPPGTLARTEWQRFVDFLRSLVGLDPKVTP